MTALSKAPESRQSEKPRETKPSAPGPVVDARGPWVLPPVGCAFGLLGKMEGVPSFVTRRTWGIVIMTRGHYIALGGHSDHEGGKNWGL